MEYNFWLVVCQSLMLIGAGVAFISPLRKRAGWQWWFPAIFVLAILPMDMGYRSNDGGIIVLCHMLTYLILVLMVNRCTTLSVLDTFYCAVWIMITAELTHEIWLLFRMQWAQLQSMDLRSSTGLLVFASLFYWLISRTLARWLARGDLYEAGVVRLLLALVVGGMCVTLGYLFMIPGNHSVQERLVVVVCQTFCGTIMYLNAEANRRKMMENKLDILNLLCDFGAKQYETAAENVRIVNEKCGELEEKIRQMEQYLPEKFRSESRETIRDARRSIDSVVRTGNEVLDIVLTEKNLAAEVNGTRINCVADGKLLDFMETVDLYALFSFGLETALEDVALFSDESHRLIDLLIHECQNFAVINLTYPLSEEADNAARSRTRLNNYKMMVLYRVVEKYHGMQVVEKKDGLFSLKVVFPRSANK